MTYSVRYPGQQEAHMDTDTEPIPDPAPTVCPACRGSGVGYALAPGPRCEGPPACRTCGGCGMVVEEVDDV
jgi:DnaJ-class molecular chaperone